MPDLTFRLEVTGCPDCGGDHGPTLFRPVKDPTGGKTHAAVCPATGREFLMDTRAHPGVWERFLAAAGVKP